MEATSLKQMRQRYPQMELVYEILKPHEYIKYDCPIQVYYEDEIFNTEGETYFWVINNGEFVSNYVSFPCRIGARDQLQIAKDLVEELLSKSDFSELDAKLQEKSACEEFEAMYSIPHHLNDWDTRMKWNKIYGRNSENNKRYMTNKMIGYMNSYMHVCGGEKKMIKEILNYGKNHDANKYKKLFK